MGPDGGSRIQFRVPWNDKRRNAILAFEFICLFLFSAGGKGALAAQSPGSPDPDLPAQAGEALRLANERANQAAARHLGVSTAAIQSCRDAGFPLFFSMFQAVIAQEAGLTVAEVNAARLLGYHWGEMCEAWGLSLPDVRKRVQAAFVRMREEGTPPPPPTGEESLRAAGTGSRERALPPRGPKR